MSGEVIATSTKEALFNTLKNNADLKKKLAELVAENKAQQKHMTFMEETMDETGSLLDKSRAENNELIAKLGSAKGALEVVNEGYMRLKAENEAMQKSARWAYSLFWQGHYWYRDEKAAATLTKENKDD